MDDVRSAVAEQPPREGPTPEHRRLLYSDPENLLEALDFELDHLDWHQIHVPAEGRGMPEELRGKVDFQAYFDWGLWNAFVDSGPFNILGVRLAPEFTIPRHHHFVGQLVLVHSGEVWQGAKRFVPGDGYFTRARHPYSVTAGPDGATIFEIRADPIQTMGLVWDERDPAKWAHGRRPGGPAAQLLES